MYGWIKSSRAPVLASVLEVMTIGQQQHCPLTSDRSIESRRNAVQSSLQIVGIKARDKPSTEVASAHAECRPEQRDHYSPPRAVGEHWKRRSFHHAVVQRQSAVMKADIWSQLLTRFVRPASIATDHGSLLVRKHYPCDHLLARSLLDRRRTRRPAPGGKQCCCRCSPALVRTGNITGA